MPTRCNKPFHYTTYYKNLYGKILFFFRFLCKYVLSSSLPRNRYIRRIDIDSLKVHIMFCLYLSLFMYPMQFYLLLYIRVLIDCTSCLDNFDPIRAWSSTSQKRFLENNSIKTMIQFGLIQYCLFAFAFQSP